MSSQPFDSEQYKKSRLQGWDAAAPAWQQWSKVWHGATQHISERLIELAEIAVGQRVLDIATGLGEPAVSAARRVGPTGRVVATDFSPAMLELARERAAAMGIENIEFRQIDAEALDFPGETFDATLNRWGVNEFLEVTVAFQKIHQHLMPGGRFALAVWATAPEVPFLSVPAGIVRQLFDIPAPAPGTLGPFVLAEKARLVDVLTRAGFDEIHIEDQIVTIEFPSFKAFRAYLEDASPSVQEVLKKQPTERQTETWQATAEAVQQFTSSDGSLEIPYGTICAVGQK